MAILFDFYHSPATKGADEKQQERFHARVVNCQSLDLDNIVNRISQRCTLSKGDIKAVISELSEEIASGLLQSKNVYIPEIGGFSLSLKAPKDADPQKTHAQNIGIKRIEFRASTLLKQKVQSQAVFERCRDKVHSDSISNDEMDKLLVDYFEKHAFLTRKAFENLCHLTRSTATRHLKRLLNEGRLTNTNTQRYPIFVLVN